MGRVAEAEIGMEREIGMEMGREREEGGIRLSKLMAQRGLCSRREADVLIAEGMVEVDGEVVRELGSKVALTARIRLQPAAQQRQALLVSLILNKPIGYVSAQPEPGYRPAISLILPENQIGHQRQRLRRAHLRGLAVAGRLDIDSQGLLLFTQDGRLARQIIGEERRVEKEYLVRVQGPLTEEAIRRLRFGLSLDGKPLLKAGVERLNADQLRIILREGRKRQIRRMCQLVGLDVVGLKRVRIGPLRLGSLPEGQWRFLDAAEVAALVPPPPEDSVPLR
jgi:23S rRNA pseudouridine2604 synthase